MKYILSCCCLLVFVAGASAHRLDELLQATRISVANNHIDLFIDLTPGVAVVGQVMAVVDTDEDGTVSKEEGEEYARRVLRDLSLELDGQSLAVTKVDVRFPLLLEMKAGSGVIHISAAAPITLLKNGRHTLALTNAHLPDISVFLVNALVPKDPSIRIATQIRDENQMNYRLEFVSDALLP